jgi:hypothetical protein
MDPFVILAAFAPVLVDAAKGLIGKFIGSDFKPANVADWIAMQRADVDRFKALNEAGGANPSYPWVEAIIRLQRPIYGGCVLIVWGYSQLTAAPLADLSAINNFAGAIGFYLFGDRTLFHAKPKATK